MTHTPWPWTEHEGFILGRFNSDNEIHDICDTRCAPPDDDTICEMDANAILIAAAPELLEALKESLVILEASYLDWAETPYESQNSNGDVIFEVKERVKEVIAKATGEPK